MRPLHRSGHLKPNRIERDVTLCEVLDRVLNKGVVITGEVVVSVAGIDLLYVALNVVATSVQTALNEKARMVVVDAA